MSWISGLIRDRGEIDRLRWFGFNASKLRLESWSPTTIVLLCHPTDVHALAAAIIWYHLLHILLYAEPTIHDIAYMPKVSATLPCPWSFVKSYSGSCDKA